MLNPVVDQPGGSMARLLGHGFAGWAACAALIGLLLRISSVEIALGVHAVAAPVIFALVSRRYFGARGAREALVTALTFVAIVALLDLIVVAGLIQRSLVMFGRLIGTWVPFALIFAVTWATGEWRWIAGSRE
jgi:hypothetical protein